MKINNNTDNEILIKDKSWYLKEDQDADGHLKTYLNYYNPKEDKYTYRTIKDKYDLLRVLNRLRKNRKEQNQKDIDKLLETFNKQQQREKNYTKALTINGKPCYLTIRQDANGHAQKHLNYYNSENKEEEGYESIKVNNQEDTLKLLKNFHNPQTNKEYKQIEKANCLLWASLFKKVKDIRIINGEKKQILTFGLNINYGKNIIHRKDAVYYLRYGKDDDGNSHQIGEAKLLDGILTDVKCNIDLLQIKDKEYELTYYDNISQMERTFKGNSVKEVAKELEIEAMYIQSKNDLHALVTEFIHLNKFKN